MSGDTGEVRELVGKSGHEHVEIWLVVCRKNIRKQL